MDVGWLSVPQVADALGVHPMTVRRMVADGELPAYKWRRRCLRVDPSDLASFVMKCRTGSGDAAEGAAGSNEDLVTKLA